MNEITSTSSLGALPPRKLKKASWKDYIRRATAVIKSNGMKLTNENIIVLANALRKSGK